MILLYSPAENLTPEASSTIDIAAARELHGRSSGRGAMAVAWPSASEEPRRRAGSAGPAVGGSEGRRLASREQGAGAKGWPRAGSIDAGPAVGEERRSHGRGATVAAGRSRATSQGARQAARRERRPRTSRGRGAAKPARPRAFAWPDHPRSGSSKRQAASGYPSSGIAARRRRQ